MLTVSWYSDVAMGVTMGVTMCGGNECAFVWARLVSDFQKQRPDGGSRCVEQHPPRLQGQGKPFICQLRRELGVLLRRKM